MHREHAVSRRCSPFSMGLTSAWIHTPVSPPPASSPARIPVSFGCTFFGFCPHAPGRKGRFPGSESTRPVHASSPNGVARCLEAPKHRTRQARRGRKGAEMPAPTARAIPGPNEPFSFMGGLETSDEPPGAMHAKSATRRLCAFNGWGSVSQERPSNAFCSVATGRPRGARCPAHASSVNRHPGGRLPSQPFAAPCTWQRGCTVLPGGPIQQANQPAP